MGGLSGKCICNIYSLKNNVEFENDEHYTNSSIYILEANFNITNINSNLFGFLLS